MCLDLVLDRARGAGCFGRSEGTVFSEPPLEPLVRRSGIAGAGGGQRACSLVGSFRRPLSDTTRSTEGACAQGALRVFVTGPFQPVALPRDSGGRRLVHLWVRGRPQVQELQEASGLSRDCVGLGVALTVALQPAALLCPEGRALSGRCGAVWAADPETPLGRASSLYGFVTRLAGRRTTQCGVRAGTQKNRPSLRKLFLEERRQDGGDGSRVGSAGREPSRAVRPPSRTDCGHERVGLGMVRAQLSR